MPQKSHHHVMFPSASFGPKPIRFSQLTKWFTHQCLDDCDTKLVGGFNPVEKYDRQIGSSPQIGVKNKKYLKPPPSKQSFLPCFLSPLSFCRHVFFFRRHLWDAWPPPIWTVPEATWRCEINWELWSVISHRKKKLQELGEDDDMLSGYFFCIYIVIHDVMPLEESIIQSFSHIIPHPYLWWRWPRFLCARRRLFPLGITFGNQFQPLLHSSESLLFKQKKYRRKLGQNSWSDGLENHKKNTTANPWKKPVFFRQQIWRLRKLHPRGIATPESCHLEVIGNLGSEQLVCVCVLPSLKTNRFSAFETMMLEKWQCSLPKADFFGCFFWLLFCCWFWFFSGLFAVCSFCRVFEADLGGCMGQNQFLEWGVNSHLLFVSERVSMVEANKRGHYITKPNNALGWWFGIVRVPPK